MKLCSYFRIGLLAVYAFAPFMMGAASPNLGGGGCGSNVIEPSPAPPTPPSPEATLTSIAVTPADPSILIQETQQFTATGTYSDNSTADITALVAWSSSDESLVTIDDSGLATAGPTETPAPVTISATLDSIQGSTTLSVVDLSPAVTNVSPATGSTSGGESVVLTGVNFTGASAVYFGSSPAASFTVDSDTSITATSPAGSAGSVDISVVTNHGSSAANPSDQFTYVAAPTVTALSPSSGSTAGGTSVILTGTGFSTATSVNFGSTSASSFVIDSDTQISAVSPAASAGTVDVTVTTPYGTSPTSSADEFTSIAPMMILFAAGPTNGNLGGRIGADSICSNAIPTGVSCAHLHAFISVDASDEIQDMPSNYNVPTDVQIASKEGNIVQNNWADLLGGSILMSLVNANILTNSDTFWWSGSNDNGSLSSSHCGNWTASTSLVSGYSGYYNQTSTAWISAGAPDCSQSLPLLCLCYE